MMHCRLMEVQSACCTDPSNCPEGDPTPHECPVECALVFPFFLESCGDALAAQGGDMEEYEKHLETEDYEEILAASKSGNAVVWSRLTDDEKKQFR